MKFFSACQSLWASIKPEGGMSKCGPCHTLCELLCRPRPVLLDLLLGNARVCSLEWWWGRCLYLTEVGELPHWRRPRRRSPHWQRPASFPITHALDRWTQLCLGGPSVLPFVEQQIHGNCIVRVTLRDQTLSLRTISLQFIRVVMCMKSSFLSVLNPLCGGAMLCLPTPLLKPLVVPSLWQRRTELL